MNIENYKMPEEEIKKALECCSVQDKNLCRVCPLSELQGECVEIMAKNALDLIKCNTAEIERLNTELVGMRGAANSYKMHYDNAKAEIERLKKPNENI